MIEVVINYDRGSKMYKVYESSTKTVLISENISQALINLSEFLKSNGLETNNILDSSDIMYHLDSATMRAIVESNFNLIKRLNQAPTGFMMSDRRFNSGGGSIKSSQVGDKSGRSNGLKGRRGSTFGHGSFVKSSKKFGSK